MNYDSGEFKEEARNLGILEPLKSEDYLGKCATRTIKAKSLNMCKTAQEMRVWPLGTGLQEQVLNHLKLLW
jgi:hypothetical protein